MSARMPLDEDAPIFAIAMAAELSELHPQTLRQYDRIGLVSPQRTAGRVRRYSLRDVAQLREVAELSQQGVSLEGISRILALQRENDELHRRVRALESELANERLARRGGRVFAAGSAGDVVSLASGRRAERRTGIVVYRPMLSSEVSDDVDDIDDETDDLDDEAVFEDETEFDDER